MQREGPHPRCVCATSESKPCPVDVARIRRASFAGHSAAKVAAIQRDLREQAAEALMPDVVAHFLA